VIIISDLLLINETESIKHIESLAFNRVASSIGETKAIDYIYKELDKENIVSKLEYFDWTGPTRILIRTSYLIILTYLLLSRLILIIVVYFVVKNMFEKTRKITLIKKESSKNIFTNIPATQKSKDNSLIIFSAHYDSVSANIPYRIQFIIFSLYRLVIAFYGVIIVVLSIWLTLDLLLIFTLPQNIVALIALISLSGVIISIPILYLVFNEKPSACSIDNASGVSILIELAKIFNKNPLDNIDLIFLWTGAEEWGLRGSKKFCEDYYRKLNQIYDMNKSININIDMVGTYIGLLDKVGLFRRKKLNKGLNDIFTATAKQLNIPIKRYNKIIEPKSDHIIFRRCSRRAKKKMQIVYFHSDKDSKYIHSLRDTPDKCSIENLNGCINICYQALRSIDSRL